MSETFLSEKQRSIFGCLRCSGKNVQDLTVACSRRAMQVLLDRYWPRSDSGRKARTIVFKRLSWSHNRGHHAGRDRQTCRETPWRPGLLSLQEGQLADWEGLSFYYLLPGADEMPACLVETFYLMAEGCAPRVFHTSPILTLVVPS